VNQSKLLGTNHLLRGFSIFHNRQYIHHTDADHTQVDWILFEHLL